MGLGKRAPNSISDGGGLPGTKIRRVGRIELEFRLPTLTQCGIMLTQSVPLRLCHTSRHNNDEDISGYR